MKVEFLLEGTERQIRKFIKELKQKFKFKETNRERFEIIRLKRN